MRMKKKGDAIKQFSGSENHHGNFLKAVRSRNYKDLNADILEGHLSSSLCHTGNISYRLGHQERPDKIRDAIKADRGATETFERMAAHLEANGVDINKDKLALGWSSRWIPKPKSFAETAKPTPCSCASTASLMLCPKKLCSFAVVAVEAH